MAFVGNRARVINPAAGNQKFNHLEGCAVARFDHFGSNAAWVVRFSSGLDGHLEGLFDNDELQWLTNDKETTMHELDIEKEIQDKGLTAPRLRPSDIDAVIVREDYHRFPGTNLMVCCLVLTNEFTVTGTSACASADNYNEELGRKIARQNAKNQIWALEGYLLRQRLFEQSQTLKAG